MSNMSITAKEFVIYILIFALTFGILGFVIGDVIGKKNACKAGVGAYITNDSGNPKFVYTNSHEFEEFMKKHSKALEKKD